VLDGSYGANRQSIALAKGQAARLAYVTAFVEDAKASGVIAKAIAAAGGNRGIEVATRHDPVLTGTVPGAKH
jgi:hypothetical protein